SFISQYADFDIMALASERDARLLQQEADFAGAHTVAARGANLFPQSPGGTLCRNLVNEIEAPSASISTERVWNCFEGSAPDAARDACPSIVVHYRNVSAVYFRAVPYDWEFFLQQRHNRPENLSDQERRQILAKTPALEWSAQLPPTSD